VGAQPFPLDSEEVQVNAFTTGEQWPTSAAALPDGRFVVTWISRGSFGDDGDGNSVQLRLISAGGEPLGPREIQANTFTTGHQEWPRVAALDDGNFVMVWYSEGSFGDDEDESVQARRFRSDGVPLDASEFQVNTYTPGSQAPYGVAALAGGGFVVVWSSYGSWGSDDSFSSIQARRFGAEGVALDPMEVQVNSYSTGRQTSPRVASAADGSFVVVWTSEGSLGGDNWLRSIQARRFAAGGTPLDPVEFQVNSYTRYDQAGADVSMTSEGDFVVAWTSSVTNGNDLHIGVQARRFAADGTPRDPEEFQVNVITNGGQGGGPIAFNAEGDFVIGFGSTDSPGDDPDDSPQARRYQADGTPVDAIEFQLNTYTTSWQFGPSIAAGPDGDFLAVWPSRGSYGDDSSEMSVQARRFGRPTIPVTSTSGGTGGPDCTLRDAIAAANSGTAVGGCAAGNEGAVVALPPRATIALSEPEEGVNALPPIVRSVTVAGRGARIERDRALPCPGGPDLRLFEVTDRGVLTLSDVTVAGGCLAADDGGGVLAEGGALVLERATIEDHRAGGSGGGVAIRDGSLWVLDSTFADNVAGGFGGGLAIGNEPGLARISGSTFSGNTATEGGGLALVGTVSATLVNSTLTDNLAGTSGGGIEVGPATADLALDFATVTGNAAPAGAALHAAKGRVAIHGSLVGESPAGADCAVADGVLSASGANLDTDGSCAALAGGAVSTVASLELRPLGANGGPTRSRPPHLGSPALDAAPECATGSGAAIARDQRGYPRPRDDDFDDLPECDLGAIELGYLFVDGFETGSTANWSATVP
jgi:hypothetical protein